MALEERMNRSSPEAREFAGNLEKALKEANLLMADFTEKHGAMVAFDAMAMSIGIFCIGHPDSDTQEKLRDRAKRAIDFGRKLV